MKNISNYSRGGGGVWPWNWDLHGSINTSLHGVISRQTGRFLVLMCDPQILFRMCSFLLHIFKNSSLSFIHVSQIGYCSEVFTTFLILELYLARSEIRGVYLHSPVSLHDTIVTPRSNFHPILSMWRNYVSFILTTRFRYRSVSQKISLHCIHFWFLIFKS
jgi:hypothetical protein